MLASSGTGRPTCVWLGFEPVFVPAFVFLFLGKPSLLSWLGVDALKVDRLHLCAHEFETGGSA